MFIKSKLNNKRGTEVIEFVIMFPMVIFLIFSSMSFMLAIYSKIIVADAAREGARAEALSVEPAEDKVLDVIAGFGLKQNLLDSVDVYTEDEGGIEYIYVEVVYKQPSMFPGLPRLVGGSDWPNHFVIRSQATFKKEKI